MTLPPRAPRIVATNRVFAETRALFPPGATLVAPAEAVPMSRTETLAAAADADGLMAFMTDRIDEAFLAACPGLRAIGAALKGFDNIDVEAAAAAGVWVSVVPDLLTAPTAELTVGLMIALGRHLVAADAELRRDGFAGWRPRFYGVGLDGATVSLIGYGAVGRAIARRLAGFGCRILAHDPAVGPGAAPDDRTQQVCLADALAEGDWVVLAAPLTPATRGLIDAAALAGMKPGALLVNPARGSLVDEAAVADALADGRLGGYAADVFALEDWAQPDRPQRIDPRLTAAGAPTVLTPHIGSAVAGVRRAIERAAAEAILAALGGHTPPGAVNSPDATRLSARIAWAASRAEPC